jgi:serine/threonine-protein kinase RsbT
MTTELPATIVPIHSETDVILARQAGRALAQSLGFSAVDQARITTAISELARNIVIYGVRGSVLLREVGNGTGKRGVELLFDDEGPGIADIPQAMEQGFSSGRGLGAGLPGSRRLMDDFEIHSTPGEGLHIVVRKWR